MQDARLNPAHLQLLAVAERDDVAAARHPMHFRNQVDRREHSSAEADESCGIEAGFKDPSGGM